MSDRRENSVLFSLRELRSIGGRSREARGAMRSKRASSAGARAPAKRRDPPRPKEGGGRARSAPPRIAVRAQGARRRRARRARVAAAPSRVRAPRADRSVDEARADHRIRRPRRARKHGRPSSSRPGMVVGGIVGRVPLLLIAGGTMAYLVQKHNVELAQQQAALKASCRRSCEGQGAHRTRDEAEKRKAETQKKAELEEQRAKASRAMRRPRDESAGAAWRAADDSHSSKHSRELGRRRPRRRRAGGRSRPTASRTIRSAASTCRSVFVVSACSTCSACSTLPAPPHRTSLGSARTAARGATRSRVSPFSSSGSVA